MKNPFFSIIIPFYNSKLYLKACIESCFDDQDDNTEIIIVNDGSTDRTIDVCRNFSENDKRIHIISQENKGQGSARNKGIEHSNGEYIAFIDSDDLWLSDKLELQLPQFLTGKSDLIFTSGYSFLSDFPDEIKNSFIAENCIYKGETGFKVFYEQNKIPLSSILANKRIFLKYGFFLERKDIHEDYELWLRMLRNGAGFSGWNHNTFKYRVHSGSSSAGTLNSLFKELNTLRCMKYPDFKNIRTGNTYRQILHQLLEENRTDFFETYTTAYGKDFDAEWLASVIILTARISPAVTKKVINRMIPGMNLV